MQLKFHPNRQVKMDSDSKPTPLGPQADSRLYLVGSLRADKALVGPCPYAQTLYAYSYAYSREVVAVLTCNRWGCQKCGPRKAKRLAYRIQEAIPNRLITLTIDPKKYETPRQAYDETRRCLGDFSKNIRKRLGEFEYFRVLEITKKGWPHYHMMARCPYISQKLISEIWARMTGAPIVDIRRIYNNFNAFSYVVKYLCKQTMIPWTNRRTAWSKGFFPKQTKYEPVKLRLIDCELVNTHPQCSLREEYPNYVLEQFSPTMFILRPPDDEEELIYTPPGEGVKHELLPRGGQAFRLEPRPENRETMDQ